MSDTPTYVQDGFGNLWHHYNDVGYVRLMVTTDPGQTLAEIIGATGAARVLEVVQPFDLLARRFPPTPAATESNDKRRNKQ